MAKENLVLTSHTSPLAPPRNNYQIIACFLIAGPLTFGVSTMWLPKSARWSNGLEKVISLSDSSLVNHWQPKILHWSNQFGVNKERAKKWRGEERECCFLAQCTDQPALPTMLPTTAPPVWVPATLNHDQVFSLAEYPLVVFFISSQRSSLSYLMPTKMDAFSEKLKRGGQVISKLKNFIEDFLTYWGLYLTKNVNDYLFPRKKKHFPEKGAGGQRLLVVSPKIHPFWWTEASSRWSCWMLIVQSDCGSGVCLISRPASVWNWTEASWQVASCYKAERQRRGKQASTVALDATIMYHATLMLQCYINVKYQ